MSTRSYCVNVCDCPPIYPGNGSLELGEMPASDDRPMCAREREFWTGVERLGWDHEDALQSYLDKFRVDAEKQKHLTRDERSPLYLMEDRWVAWETDVLMYLRILPVTCYPIIYQNIESVIDEQLSIGDKQKVRVLAREAFTRFLDRFMNTNTNVERMLHVEGDDYTIGLLTSYGFRLKPDARRWSLSNPFPSRRQLETIRRK